MTHEHTRARIDRHSPLLGPRPYLTPTHAVWTCHTTLRYPGRVIIGYDNWQTELHLTNRDWNAPFGRPQMSLDEAAITARLGPARRRAIRRAFQHLGVTLPL